MIVFSILLLVLYNIFTWSVLKKSILRKISITFASLYAIFFSVAYIFNWIPLGLLYTGITYENIVISNFAYLNYCLIVGLFPESTLKKKTDRNVENIYFWTFILLICYVLYFYPYLMNISKIVSASVTNRRALYSSIRSIVTFRVFINVYCAWVLYKSNIYRHRICLIITLFCLISINALHLYCGNRRETFLVLLMLVPKFIPLAVKKQKETLNLISKKHNLIKNTVIVVIIIFMLTIPFIRQGNQAGTGSIKSFVSAIVGVIDTNAAYQTLSFELNNTGVHDFVFLGSYFKAIPKILTGVFKIPINVKYTMEQFQSRIGAYFGYSHYGVGWTYSPFSEAYLSFGYVGLFLLFPIVYSIVLYSFVKKKEFSDFDIGFSCMFIYQFFRGDFANFAQIWATYMLIILVIEYVDKRVSFSNRHRNELMC